MAALVDGVINVLSNLQMSLASAGELVIEGMRQLGQLRLWHKSVSNPAEMIDGPIVEEVPHVLAGANGPELLAQAQGVGKMLIHLVPLRMGMGTIYRPFRNGIGLRLIHQVSGPGSDWLNQNLSPLALQEFKHVEVAVAFGELGPEFPGDFDHRFDTSAVHFDGVQFVAGRLQGIEIILAPHMLVPFPKSIECVAQNLVALELGFRPVRCLLFDLKRLAILEILAQSVHRLAKDPVGLSLGYLERTNLVDEIVDHVPELQSIQHSEAEIDGKLQPRFTGLGLDSIAVFE